MQDITKLENDLWEVADQLRANSKLTAYGLQQYPQAVASVFVD